MIGNRKRWLVSGLVAGPVVLFASVYLLLFTPDSPPPLGLSAGDPSATSPASVGDPAGTWNVSSW